MVRRVTRLKENINIESLKFAKAKRLSNEASSENIILFSIDVVSSQRTLTQTVTLLFSTSNDVSNRLPKYLVPPISRCTCEAGKYICAHMIISLSVFMGLQGKLKSYSWDDIVKSFPKRIILGNSILIPASLMYPNV